MYFPFFWDPTMILIIIGLIISGLASTYVQSTYSKYSEVKSKHGYTASNVCRQILDKSHLENVRLEGIRGKLTDHYNAKG